MARIYQTYNMGEAHVRVAIVDTQGEADLLVHRVSSWGMASGDKFWYITKDREEATAWVYFGSRGFCDVLVHFVDNRGSAGWQRESRYKGRFG